MIKKKKKKFVSEFYQSVNVGELLTNWIKPEGIYVKFVSGLSVFTHR